MLLAQNRYVFFAAFAAIPAIFAQTQFCLGPSVAVSNADMKAVTDGIIDMSLVSYTSGNKRFFLAHGGVNNEGRILKVSGSASRPVEYRAWPGTKTQERLFTAGNIPVNVNGLDYNTALWITNIYQDPSSGGLLAFVHVEAFAVPPQPPGGDETVNESLMKRWVGRVGLAWSSDNGETFTFLGHIVKPYSSAGEPRLHYKNYPTGSGIDIANVQGVPYFVAPVNGEDHFFIYFQERDYGYSIGAARAKVSDVINAAKNGTVTAWSKFHNGAWASSGLGGQATPMTGLSGVTHTAAGFNPARNKAYMILTFPGGDVGGGFTSVKLYESSTFTGWTEVATLVSEARTNQQGPGYQYAWIIPSETAQNPNPPSNGQIADKFHVYSIKRYDNPDDFFAQRWTVDVSQTPQACSGNSIPPAANLAAGNFNRDGVVFYSNGSAYCRYSQASSPGTSVTAIPNGMANNGVCQPTPAMTAGYFKVVDDLFYTDLASACRTSNQSGGTGPTYLAQPSYLPFVGWSCNVPVNGSISGQFLNRGTMYWSNGSQYCRYWQPQSTSGVPVIDPIPNSIANVGVCTGNVPAGWFIVQGVLYYSNGGSHYCTASNQNPAGRNPTTYWGVPPSMIHDGVCTGG